MSYLTYAQNFEDVLLWRGLRGIKNGQYLDIGAQDPIVDSVSLSFYEAGWRGIHVEPTPFYATRLREARPDETVIEAAVTDDPGPIEFFEIPNTGLSTGKADIAERHSAADFQTRKVVVPCVRLDKLLGMAKGDLHWLKIDVEGMEADVLRSWGTSKKRPWLLVVESTLPNSLEPTEHLWLHELVSRGYKDVYFDGLSRYFVHEKHSDLERFFGPPANVFDGFEVSVHHFATRRLRAELDETEQRLTEARSEAANLRSEHQRAEQRLAEMQPQLELSEQRAEQERGLVSDLRLQLSQAEQRVADEQRRVAELQIRIEASESRAAQEASAASDLRLELGASQQRVAEGQALAASLQAKLTDAEKAREAANVELRASLETLVSAQSDHRASIEALWKERQAAEAQLRQSLHDAVSTGAIAQSELARLQERQVRLQEQVAAVQRELSERTAERADLDAQLQMRVADLSQVQALINRAASDRPGPWARLGAVFGRSQPRPSWVALTSWSPSTVGAASPANPPVSNQADHSMQLPVPYGGRNPFLRASSLPELLSWNDVDFVRCAYVTVLGRRPDHGGEAYYTDRLRSGASKLQILWQLRKSREAKNHDPGIAGFDRTLRQYRRAGLPVIGPLISPRYSSEWSPAERRVRRIENSIWRAHDTQAYRLGEIERRIERSEDWSAPLATSAGDGEATRQEILLPGKSSIGFLEPSRDGGTEKIAADVLSRFSHAAVLNIRSKLSAS